MKVGICDDQSDQLARIKSSMDLYAAEHINQIFEVECFSNSFDFLEHLEKVGSYDILLLDICMPGVLGTDIAKHVRNQKGKTEIIFLTTSPDYAVEAFALKAAHYLIKPFTQEQFNEALDRVVVKVTKNANEMISIKTCSGNLRIVELSEIMYVESYRHIQSIYLKDGQNIDARETLSKLFDLFEDISKDQFICPYKGFIVNQKNIRAIESDKIILKNGKEIPIVKRNFTVIKERYFNFMFENDKE